MAKSAALSVQHAWNSVALEERLELVSKCQADGLLAALTFTFMMGAVAYGFDKIYLLLGALLAATLIMPMFSSHTWRRGKPALILQYLAARSIARRYAYGFGITDLDIVLIFRGTMARQFITPEDEMAYMSNEDVELDTQTQGDKQVWICLMRAGLVLLSEKNGGAKMEFCSQIAQDTVCHQMRDENGQLTGALTVTGSGQAKGRKVVLSSRHAGAMYVFEKQLLRLVQEAPDSRKF